MKIKDIITALEDFAPCGIQENWDNSGVQVGLTDIEVSGVMLSVDVTEHVLERAKNLGCNLIISHHPLIFSPMKSVTGCSSCERIVMAAIKSEITIYSAHTNYDSVCGGVSFKMAERLGMTNLKILDLKNGFDNVGLGVVGDIEAYRPADFLDLLKEKFDLKYLRYSEICKDEIKRVALCGGSGGSLIDCALNSEVDIYVSADFKYHDFQRPDSRMIIADIGHYESEKYIIEIFCDVLSKKNYNFANRIFIEYVNPVYYR